MLLIKRFETVVEAIDLGFSKKEGGRVEGGFLSGHKIIRLNSQQNLDLLNFLKLTLDP